MPTVLATMSNPVDQLPTLVDLTIVSPNSKEILLVSTIPLRAKSDAHVREIFWFAGKQFVGKAAPNQVLEWTATTGDYELTALTIMAVPVGIASRYDENTRK
jgi:membrane carboxypeptidase/penicillin-binding protein PbpC